MDLTVGSRHYHVSLLMLCIVALALAAWFSRGDGAAESDASSGWNATAKKFHWTIRLLSGQVVTFAHQKARLEQNSARQRQRTDSALAAAVLLAQSVDSLHRAPLTAAVRRVGEACGEQLNTCEQRVGAAWGAFETEHTLRLLATTRVAHADSIIARGMQVGDTKHFHVAFLTLPKPRKTVAAAVGCFLGALVAHADPGVGCAAGAASLLIVSPTQ